MTRSVRLGMFIAVGALAACRESAPEDSGLVRGEAGATAERGVSAAVRTGRCTSDRHCAFADPCLQKGCGLVRPATERVKCEEGVMGPRRRCLCELGRCTEYVRAP